jgi:hypothetical protein
MTTELLALISLRIVAALCGDSLFFDWVVRLVSMVRSSAVTRTPSLLAASSRARSYSSGERLAKRSISAASIGSGADFSSY